MKNIVKRLKELGFYDIRNRTVIHHLLKDFKHYTLVDYKFFILPIQNSFITVAVLNTRSFLTADNGRRLVVKFTVSADDILFGLRQKFTDGNNDNPLVDISDIELLIASPDVTTHVSYVKKRFVLPTARSQAKIRAFLIMVRDYWKGNLS